MCNKLGADIPGTKYSTCYESTYDQTGKDLIRDRPKRRWLGVVKGS